MKIQAETRIRQYDVYMVSSSYLRIIDMRLRHQSDLDIERHES